MHIIRRAAVGLVAAVAILAALAAVILVQGVQDAAWNRYARISQNLGPLAVHPYQFPQFWGGLAFSSPSSHIADGASVQAYLSEARRAGQLVWRARFVLQMPATSPVVRDIERGQAAPGLGAADFGLALLGGGVFISNRGGTWSAPVITRVRARTTVSISTTERFSPMSGQRADITLGPLADELPLVGLTITSPDLDLVSVRGATPDAESRHEVSFTDVGSIIELQYRSQAESPVLSAVPYDATGLRAFFAALWNDVLQALPWLIVLTLVGLGALGRSPKISAVAALVAGATIFYAASVLTAASESGSYSLGVPAGELLLLFGLAYVFPAGASWWEKRFAAPPGEQGTVPRCRRIAEFLPVLIPLVPLAAAAAYLNTLSPGPITLIVTMSAAVALAGVLALAATKFGIGVTWGISCAVGLVLLATISPLALLAGPAPTLVQAAGMVAAGAIALFTVVRVAFGVCTGRRLAGSRLRPYRYLILAVFAVAAFPEDRSLFGPSISWSDVYDLSFAIVSVLSLLVLVAVVALVRDELQAGRRAGSALRMLGVALAATAWFSSTLTVRGVPVEFVAGLAMTLFWALPAGYSRRGSLNPTLPGWQSRAVRASLRLRSASRSLARLRRSMRAKLEAGDITYQEAEGKVGDLEESLRALRRSYPAPGRLDGTADAFGAYQLPSPWRQALLAAGAGFVLGLPWMVISLEGLRNTAAQPNPYGLLGNSAAVILLSVRWASYGFFFGALYPLIRGGTALAKGLTLFGAVTGPLVLQWLVSANFSGASGRTLIYTGSQLFAFFMVLGLAADIYTLKRAGVGWERIFDLHDFRVLLAWGSSVTVAVGAAVTAAIASGVTALVVGGLPSSAHQPVPQPTPTPSANRSVGP